MTPEAIRHLSSADPVMKKVIRKIGPCAIQLRERRSPFESLVRAVAHQQLHGTAAQRILERFRKLFPGKRFPTAALLATITDEQMRAAGFSGSKTAAIRDLAAKTLEGIVPTSRLIKQLEDEEIVTRLTAVRGVGRWTVEMLLIFQLGRPDVLPADDFGVRSGFQHSFGLDALPKPKELLAHGERWRPYRTTAAWYLWRAADAKSK